jgi:hypothetical protein
MITHISAAQEFLDSRMIELPEGDSITIGTFSDDYTSRIEYTRKANVNELATAPLRAGGMTALRDAVGIGIDRVGRVLRQLDDRHRPAKVLFTVFTDGGENCSRRYSSHQLREMIHHQKDKYSWDFMFIGPRGDAAPLDWLDQEDAAFYVPSWSATTVLRSLNTTYSNVYTGADFSASRSTLSNTLAQDQPQEVAL